MATSQTVRRFILTGSVAAITITGTIYGAQLKTDQEISQQRKRALELRPEEMIAQLEGTREELVRTKNELERKIENFRAKRRGETIQQGRGR